MDERLTKKLRILADAAKYDASCASSGAPKRAAGPRRDRVDEQDRDLPLLHA
jgi:hypothetical protein